MIARGIVVSIALGLAAPSLAGTQTRTSAFQYDPVSGLLIKEIIEPDSPDLCLVTTYKYDDYGNKAMVTTRNCGVTTDPTGVNTNGEAATPTGDAVFEMRTSTTTFSGGRFPTVITNALQQSETRTTDLRFGGVLNIVGPNNLVTRWNYDNLGRKTCERRSDGTATAWSYERCAAGSCPTSGTHPTLETQYRVAVTATGAPTTSTYYDRLNREVRTETQAFDGTLATQALKDMEYDAFGRVSRASRPYFVGATQNWTNFLYDILGRVTQATEPAAPEQPRTTTIYSGLITTVTVSNVINGTSTGVGMPEGAVQTRATTKNSQGQVVQVKDTRNSLLSYAYDEFGNLKTTTDALGNVTALSYDLRGRKTQMLDPDMGRWTYHYNALGELIWQCDPVSRGVNNDCTDAMATRTTYDLLGRMKSRTERDLTSKWFYDSYPTAAPEWNATLLSGLAGSCATGVGKLCYASADNGYRRLLTYDNLGRPRELNALIDTTYLVKTSYVSSGIHLGKVEALTYPTGFGITNKYDDFGSLKELRVFNPGADPNFAANDTLLWQAKKFSASGQVTEELLGGTSSSLTQTRLFDVLDRLKSVVASGTGGSVHNLAYTYDVVGNALQRIDSVNSVTENFTYDNLNRLTSASGPSTTTRSFYYTDPIGKIGNITNKSDAGDYTYPPSGPNSVRPHAVSSIVGTVKGLTNPLFDYDANGNLTKAHAAGSDPCLTSPATGERCTTYMSFNMPDTIKGSAATYAYTYSPEHERVRLVMQLATGTQTNIYLHPGGGGNLFYEKETKTDSTLEHKHYVQAGTMLVGVYVTKTNGQGPQMQYFHRDSVGSVMAVSNEAGARIEPFGYEPFGQRRSYTGAADPSCSIFGVTTDRGFTAHEHLDDGLCLIHMNGRVYDPLLGRFLTADPFVQSPANLQSYNRYSYAFNNPLANTDPSGYYNLGHRISHAWKNNTAVRAIAAIIVFYYTGVYEGGVFGAGAESFSVAAAGFASGYVASGGDFEAGFNGAFAASLGLFAGGFAAAQGFGAYSFGAAGAQAVAACVGAAASGDCGRAALSAGFAQYAGSNYGFRNPAADIMWRAVLGGTGSRLGGGKFANGAVTGAFTYLLSGLSAPQEAAASNSRYGLWIEGSSPEEVGPHLSLGVGEPLGINNTFSFGHESGPLLGGQGAVYLDTITGGQILRYYPLTPNQAEQITNLLADSIGTPGTYNLLLNNCRHWTYDTLQNLVQQYNLVTGPIPVRVATPSGDWPGGSSGRGLVYTSSP